MTEGGKNYKLDELIGYYLIYLHYIINPTNPNLSLSQSKLERQIQIYQINLNAQSKLKIKIP